MIERWTKDERYKEEKIKNKKYGSLKIFPSDVI